ncbi:phosphate ABC transporter substrate-binding protein [Lutibacter sp. B2]|nr:phosphate ABC transporter substrate-binding protein [Lutibacter sp. B2]
MKRLSMIFLMMILIVSLAVGCSNSEPTKAEAKEPVGKIVFKGSSTLAPVITQITKDFKEKYKTWDQVNENFANEDIEIFITGGGSGAGVKSVIDGSANVGMVSRPVTEEEQKTIEGYKEYKLGTDALTISVNPENKIYEVKDTLTTEELKKIFSGEYKYWDELDAKLAHEEIVLITRDIGGGAHKVFEEKIMGDSKVSENVIQAPSMGALVTKIIENKNAIGYASYGVVNQNEGKIMPLKVDGVEPTAENIKNGSYIISRPLLVITNKDVTESEQVLLDQIVSEEGLKVVEELGFVPGK